MKPNRAVALLIPLVMVACASPPQPVSDVHALGAGAAVKRLAAGQLSSLPTGGVFVRVIKFMQPPDYIFPSAQHTAGILYVESGNHRLALAGQPPVDVAAGQARFHQNISHSHLNPGPGTSVWYFIAVWPSSAHGSQRVDPIANPVLESDDFSPEQLPQGVYSQVLRQVTVAASGRSGAHQFGGLSVFFVLQGSLAIRSSSGTKELRADHGAAYLPGVPLQEINTAAGQTEYLEMLTTASGQEFEVPLSQAPKG
jgi:hypothetical protein